MTDFGVLVDVHLLHAKLYCIQQGTTALWQLLLLGTMFYRFILGATAKSNVLLFSAEFIFKLLVAKFGCFCCFYDATARIIEKLQCFMC
ncbi:hypothetical protein M0804_015011 [Polistes exclamans]|nr:hypothetical protein M0804_015011 [Polistes exclamans]